jgi:hypothetical protein
MKFKADFFIVAGVMTGILLPVRLLFVEFVSDSTFGSLGLISIISIVMIILVKKKKLGWFGVMFENELTRLTTGKRRTFIFVWLTILTIYFAFSIYSIDQANTVYYDDMQRIKLIVIDEYTLDFEKPETIIETLDPEQVVSGIDEYVIAIFNDFPAIAIVQGIMNDMSNGFLLHFHTIFLVESIEVLGVFVFYSITLKKKEIKVNK